MGAKVTFKIASFVDGSFRETPNEEGVWTPAFNEGQIIFVEDLQKIYLDFHGNRKCYNTPAGINYVGISDFDPTTSTEEPWNITIDGETYSPHEKDVVVFEQREFMFRKGKDEDGNEYFGWFEIGDEDSPVWNT